MRTIAVVTVGRSDFGIYRPVLETLRHRPEVRLQLLVSGAHLSPEFGWTVREIEQSRFEIAERIDMLLSADTPSGIATSMGLGLIGFARAYQRLQPDLLLVLGDRFEMHAAALAAVPFNLPVAHLHGGELTLGAMDDCLRHAITKYSHLHFVATADYAARVVQLGEEPWRVIVSGAPALDNLRSLQLSTRAELEERLDLCLLPAPVVCTFHPTTRYYQQAEAQTEQLLAALAEIQRPIIFTKPNADTNGRIVIDRIEQFVAQHPQCRLVDHLGTRAYFGLLQLAVAMVGNSSSGLIEAPSFELPVVNIGPRQAGRTRAANVIDTGHESSEISAGVRRALDPAFRAALVGLVNPYGQGHASTTIAQHLATVPLDDRLRHKQFCDLPRENAATSPLTASADVPPTAEVAPQINSQRSAA